MQIRFQIQVSSVERCWVTFIKNNNEIEVICTCQAVEMATPCEHHIDILDGKTENITSGNEDEVVTLMLWLDGSMLGRVYCAYKEAVERVDIDATRTRMTFARERLSRMVKSPPRRIIIQV